MASIAAALSPCTHHHQHHRLRARHRQPLCAVAKMASTSDLPQVPHLLLGATGLSVSVLGYGGSALGGVFAPVQEDSCRKAVHAAFNAGVNFFDTSPFYGGEKAETMLGKTLQGLPREKVVIATKVGRYQVAGPSGQEAVFDFSAERVTSSVQESLERLQTDYIDIIQCHDIEFSDLNQIVNETLPALQKLKDQGLVKHIGITGLPFKVFHTVLDRVPPGTVEVIMSYCHNSLNDRSLLGQLPYLQSKGVAVISASPLSMGLLTKQGPPAWHPAPEAVKEACRAAAQLAASKGVDISRIALMESVRTPGICSTVVSMATADLVAANVQATLQAHGLVPNPSAALEAEVLGEVQAALAGIQDRTWPSGKPGEQLSRVPQTTACLDFE